MALEGVVFFPIFSVSDSDSDSIMVHVRPRPAVKPCVRIITPCQMSPLPYLILGQIKDSEGTQALYWTAEQDDSSVFQFVFSQVQLL